MSGYFIVFEDDYLIVVDKPSGLLVIPTPKGESNTLTDLLNKYLSPKPSRAHPCHRLDRETSGLILYAKGKAIQRKMMEQFHNKLVSKKYLALIQGCPKKQSGSINFKLENKDALTKYNVLKYYPPHPTPFPPDGKANRFIVSKANIGYSLVEVELITGRTNQIRLHFKMLGYPVVGERRFAFARDYRIKSKHLMLHSSFLAFNHPISGERMCLNSQPYWLKSHPL